MDIPPNAKLIGQARAVYETYIDALCASTWATRGRVNRSRLALKDATGAYVVAPVPHNRQKLREAIHAGELIVASMTEEDV